MALWTVKTSLTMHTAPGTVAWLGSGNAKTRCVLRRAGSAMAAMIAATPRTRRSVVSLALPLLLQRKVVPDGLLSANCIFIPVTETNILYLKTRCFLAITNI